MHEGGLKNHDKQQGGACSGDAGAHVGQRDGGIVAAPEGVEVVEGGVEEGLVDGCADEASG